MNRIKISLVAILSILAVFFAGCGTNRPVSDQADTCFIYTDGLLDDLCAIEYLSGKYEYAIIMLENPEGLKDNPYASDKVQDEDDLLEVASAWFKNVTPYSGDTDLSVADFYLLGPITEFSDLLKSNPSLQSRRALLMAGDAKGPEGAGEEWNAVVDVDAYRYVTENMTNLTQVTRPECEATYETKGYPFEAEFLDEYIASMTTINENICCYDLQAVSVVLP